MVVYSGVQGNLGRRTTHSTPIQQEPLQMQPQRIHLLTTAPEKNTITGACYNHPIPWKIGDMELIWTTEIGLVDDTNKEDEEEKPRLAEKVELRLDLKNNHKTKVRNSKHPNMAQLNEMVKWSLMSWEHINECAYVGNCKHVMNHTLNNFTTRKHCRDHEEISLQNVSHF